jgi:hypothetical protein
LLVAFSRLFFFCLRLLTSITFFATFATDLRRSGAIADVRVLFSQQFGQALTTLFRLSTRLLVSLLLLPRFAAGLEATTSVESAQAVEHNGHSQSTQTAGPQSARLESPGAPSPTQTREPTAEEVQREPLLRNRAAARWAALIAGDLATAYQYESPAYREVHTIKDYAATFGGMVKWNLATVTDVRYHQEVKSGAEVVVLLDISFPLGGDDVATVVEVREPWAFVGGTWYRRSLDLSPMPGSTGQSKPSPQR